VRVHANWRPALRIVPLASPIAGARIGQDFRRHVLRHDLAQQALVQIGGARCWRPPS
jgi:hypothetical protein